MYVRGDEKQNPLITYLLSFSACIFTKMPLSHYGSKHFLYLPCLMTYNMSEAQSP